MITSAEFFESFDEAGFLKPASWTPSGGPTYAARVRFRAPSATFLDGAVRAADFEIHFVTDQLPGLAQGEQIAVDGIAYRVRQRPERLLDGTVSKADLVRVVP